MKRFFLPAAVAAVLVGVSAGTADAQIVYSYTVPANGGIVTNRTFVTPMWGQTYSTYYSPFTGIRMGQSYGTNWLGQGYGSNYGYNPWSGMGYNYGFYRPSYYFPYGGYSYGMYTYGRRW